MSFIEPAQQLQLRRATLWGAWGDLCFLAEAKLSNFWQLIVDEKKQIFTSEKFLLLASEDGEFCDL